MATGLATFDQFSWASLLKGRVTLVIAKDRTRGTRIGAALEEAGAIVTLSPSQAIAMDRCRETPFRLAVLSLSPAERISDRLVPYLEPLLGSSIVLADHGEQDAVRARLPHCRIADHSLSDRDLVLFVVSSPDE